MSIINNSTLKVYNENRYLIVLGKLTEQLDAIEVFLKSINVSTEFIEIYRLIDQFEFIFNDQLMYDHIEYKLSKIFKSVYLVNPGPFDNSNSYYHLTLKIKSSEFLSLDELYGQRLSNILKLFKLFFSKVDNFFIDHNEQILRKFAGQVIHAKKDISTYLTFNSHRDIVAKRQKLQDTDLKKLPYNGLFHIVDVDNLESILKWGILSHNTAHNRGLVKIDISDRQVNSLRNREEPVLHHNLHDYAPLYINPKNPMMYRLCKEGRARRLILLKINPHILMHGNVLFSDGNAASRSTNFYSDIADFNKLNWKCIHDQYWTNYSDGTRFRCSEVLVFGEIPLYYIETLYVYDENLLDQILPLFPNHFGIVSEINRSYYF